MKESTIRCRQSSGEDNLGKIRPQKVLGIVKVTCIVDIKMGHLNDLCARRSTIGCAPEVDHFEKRKFLINFRDMRTRNCNARSGGFVMLLFRYCVGQGGYIPGCSL